MRLPATTILLTASLFAGAALAQRDDAALELRLRSIEARLPDIDRIQTLERKVAALNAGGAAAAGEGGGGGSLFSLYQDIQALQRDVRELRGRIEELQHRAEQREQGQRDLYQDLDRRLSAIEREVGLAPEAADAAAEERNAPAGGDAAEDGADPKAVEQAYLAAFDKLQQGKQKAAIGEFETFVEAHPDSDYADNAWYWLGEAHYVDRSYDQAAAAFRRVLSDFPNSDKAPGALYKIGVIQDERGDYERARKTLQDVIDTYPEDNAAELARKRLQALEENGGQ